MPYVASLDGIRAVAILAVLVFHVSPASLRGGFTGVDVFFVLSGFLITSIQLRDIRTGGFSMREFYVRRIQRLLPNLLLMLLTVLGLWALLMSPNTAVQTARHALWAALNLSNVYIWQNLGGYWGDAAEWAPLTHTWSLGIEEQFYLIFPAAVVWLARRQPQRLVFWLGATLLLSFGLCLVGTYRLPLATFYLLPTRVWELLAGAVLAAHVNPLHPSVVPVAAMTKARRGLMAWVGLALILAGFVIVREGTAFPGVVALAPTAGTMLLLLTIVEGETRVSRLLAAPVMTRIGRLSYSLYLWHWPLITLGKVQAEVNGHPLVVGAALGCAAGCGLACAAYAWVERPLRQRGGGRARRLAVVGTGFAVVVLVSGMLALRTPQADPEHHFDRVAFNGKPYSVMRMEETPATRGIKYYDVKFPPLPEQPEDVWRTGGVRHEHGRRGAPPQVVVLGSSHALMYAQVIDDICRELRLNVAFLCADGNPAFFDTKTGFGFSLQTAREFDDARRRWLREWRPEAVIVIDRWDLWEGKTPAFETQAHGFLKELTPHAGRVLWLTQVPALRGGDAVNVREQVVARMRSKDHLPRFEPNAAEPFRQHTVAVAEQAATAFPNLRVLRADRLFYHPDGSVRYADGRSFYHADDDHLSDHGAAIAQPLLHAAIAEAHAAASPMK